ncbi:hypothetical protein NE237_029778 [Protea cynaroides]|uniref:laccase n=1 Tax=Protea cynaroides TaxID=273540 RepID=A0A9Q0GTT7_9MAGN|nr:hypothetical protein NE237_029778 [Protea cynaroides]
MVCADGTLTGIFFDRAFGQPSVMSYRCSAAPHAYGLITLSLFTMPLSLFRDKAQRSPFTRFSRSESQLSKGGAHVEQGSRKEAGVLRLGADHASNAVWTLEGPPLYVHKGETVIVDVINKGNDNMTLHWFGVRQPSSPWWDGLAYITQCPIKPGGRFRYKVIFCEVEGTLWWHAHAMLNAATVHGPIIVLPKLGTSYPFPKPIEEVPIVLGEWWKSDVMQVYRQFLRTGGPHNLSDAITINGQPGDLYPCSKQGTFRLPIQQGMTYLLCIINAGMNEIVGLDASYTKPLTRYYIVIPPGQTIDALLEANQSPNHYFMVMVARVYFRLRSIYPIFISSLPLSPLFNDTAASVYFTGALRSLASEEHPAKVLLIVDTQLISTISMNTFPCDSINNSTCQGLNGTRLAASMNNVTNVFNESFPSWLPLIFNFTTDFLPQQLQTRMEGTEVKLLDYESAFVKGKTIRCISMDNFYVAGWGFGNFDKNKDPLRYNLIDSPHQNTASVPKNGWIAIRLQADNPGLWFIHCHLERHLTWGMDTVFITKNGLSPGGQLVPPPADLPPC